MTIIGDMPTVVYDAAVRNYKINVHMVTQSSRIQGWVNKEAEWDL